MMNQITKSRTTSIALALFSVVISGIPATAKSAATPANSSAKNTSFARYQAHALPQQESRYYGLVWGVDSLRVKIVESGELVRFTYTVVDPDKAKTLHDRK